MADNDLKLIDDLLSLYQEEKRKLDEIDRWARWHHDRPHRPGRATPEYLQLAERAQAPWGDLIVGSVAQTLYVEGYRRPDAEDNSTAWRIWQANGWDARQIAVHRAALTYGTAYAYVLPGVNSLSGKPMPKMRGLSPREVIAAYDDAADDEWPLYALAVKRRRGYVEYWLYDAESVRYYQVENVGDKPKLQRVAMHNVGVCPIVRYANRFDLEGRAAGEIEPFIPVLGRIDQTTFDRLVVQRFASWIVRTIAGMSIAETIQATGGDGGNVADEAAKLKMRLAAEDILVADDPDTKFGSLPATPLDGFIDAHDADVRVLAAVSQSPAHEMLGQMANLSAEALAAARASQTAKSDERKHQFGESHEQMLRLAAHIAGDEAAATDFEAEVRWKDTEIRSLAQAADALGKLAQMLNIPVELLWEKIPGWTQQDVERAKALVQEGGVESLVRELVAAQQPPPAEPAGPEPAPEAPAAA